MLFLLKLTNFTANQKVMKTYLLRTILLLLVLFSVTSCELIGDIFQAGVATGIILFLLVIALIIWLVRRFKN